MKSALNLLKSKGYKWYWYEKDFLWHIWVTYENPIVYTMFRLMNIPVTIGMSDLLKDALET